MPRKKKNENNPRKSEVQSTSASQLGNISDDDEYVQTAVSSPTRRIYIVPLVRAAVSRVTQPFIVSTVLLYSVCFWLYTQGKAMCPWFWPFTKLRKKRKESKIQPNGLSSKDTKKLVPTESDRPGSQHQKERTLTVPNIDFEYMKKNFHKELKKIEGDHGVKFYVHAEELYAEIKVSKGSKSKSIHKAVNDRRNEALEKFTTLYQEKMYQTGIRRASFRDKGGRLTRKISKKYKNVCVKPAENSKELVDVLGPEDTVSKIEQKFRESYHHFDEPGEIEHHFSASESFCHSLSGDTKVVVKVADITKENTDAIVNAANKNLRHGGGVAAAIARAAGRVLEEESYDYICQRGPLHLGEVVKTTAGHLPSKYVLHVVGPTVNTPNYQQELQKAVENVLDECNYLKVKTVAMPAISTGTYGVPKHEGALAMVRAIQRQFYKNTLYLREIRIVDRDHKTISVFTDVFRRELQNKNEFFIDHEASTASSHQTRKSKKLRPPPSENLENDGALGSNNTRISVDEHPFAPSIDDHIKPVALHMESEENKCPICMDDFTGKIALNGCGHCFCKECLERALEVQNKCPICGFLLGEQRGNQPKGTMDVNCERKSLPGYEGSWTIVIDFAFPSGIQEEDHPNPGMPYNGTSRKAFLPDTTEGCEVLGLLKRAFNARLLFTIGRSVTTGKDDTVIWNDVHFKTKRTGGPQSYGYPDPTYLTRVKEELAVKGIK